MAPVWGPATSLAPTFQARLEWRPTGASGAPIKRRWRHLCVIARAHCDSSIGRPRAALGVVIGRAPTSGSAAPAWRRARAGAGPVAPPGARRPPPVARGTQRGRHPRHPRPEAAANWLDEYSLGGAGLANGPRARLGALAGRASCRKCASPPRPAGRRNRRPGAAANKLFKHLRSSARARPTAPGQIDHFVSLCCRAAGLRAKLIGKTRNRVGGRPWAGRAAGPRAHSAPTAPTAPTGAKCHGHPPSAARSRRLINGRRLGAPASRVAD